MQDEDRSTQPVSFIRFHGTSVLVVEHQGGEYIALKPICDMIGLDWRTQKRAIQEPYQAEFYGLKRLLPPEIAGLGGLKPPSEGDLYIRLNRVQFFLAQINPSRVLANGNHDAAAWLIALHHEWADALHDYETLGVAMKSGRLAKLREVNGLMRSIALAKDAQIRDALEALVRTELATLGHAVSPPRQGGLAGL